MPEAEVRGYVRAGFLSPERGRAARTALLLPGPRLSAHGARARGRRRDAAAHPRGPLAPARRLPDGRPLTAVRIAVEGSRVVVEDGARRWRPESGQILFDFGVADLARKVAPMVRRAFREAQEEGPEFSADDWYEWACELEPGSPAEARDGLRAGARARRRARRSARQPRAAAPRGRRRRGRRAALRGGPARAARRRDRGVQSRRGARGPGQDAGGAARVRARGEGRSATTPTRTSTRRPWQRSSASRRRPCGI